MRVVFEDIRKPVFKASIQFSDPVGMVKEGHTHAKRWLSTNTKDACKDFKFPEGFDLVSDSFKEWLYLVKMDRGASSEPWLCVKKCSASEIIFMIHSSTGNFMRLANVSQFQLLNSVMGIEFIWTEICRPDNIELLLGLGGIADVDEANIHVREMMEQMIL